MLSTILRSGLLAAFLMATTAMAAEPVKAGGHFRAKQVIGTKIFLKGGDTGVGTVEDIVFDAAGNLEYLIVDNNGKLVTVPFEAATFDIEKRTAMVPLTVEQYNAIPTYTTTTYPSYFTPTYRTEVYKYYGLSPRPLRLFNR
ncbi:PRC-barrel domain-containing protein [Zavarzinella formosa]|uniref:PRC-barrel domain-containing protein n=1 Tax=Zavarzinella formosa TaxID=360055 RepID=UPI0002DDF420|nr:PRC-barrel domain-containing protein [Zavarzinella formosa]